MLKVGDLVKCKPAAAEGDAESVGIGLVIAKNRDPYGKDFVFVQWFKTGAKWMRYVHDLELVKSNDEVEGEEIEDVNITSSA